MANAARELLAAPAEVWAFLAQPHQLADWWPGVVAVEPDRRGFATGARWQIMLREQRGLLRLADGGLHGRARAATLVIVELSPPRRWRWQLIPATGRGRLAAPLQVELELEPSGPARTLLRLTVSSRGLGSGDRLTARAALARIFSLLQTGAQS